MAEGEQSTHRDLSRQIPDLPPLITLREAREAVERDLISRALKKHGGNISQAAAELGISRPTLYELIAKLGIRRE